MKNLLRGAMGYCLLASLATPGFAQSTLIQDIDAVFADMDSSTPGCSVGVAKNDTWIHKTGYGSANLELNVPLDGSHVHRMASVSKQFTAMAVLLLADEGKVKLDADIRKYLPTLYPYQAGVSINAMLGHVSGMGDYELVADSYEGPAKATGVNLKSAAGGPFRLGNEDYLTIDEFYQVVKRLDLQQPPNRRFSYSNIAYFLLGMLVEEVSGETLRQYAHRRIFKPLGMNNSFFSDDAVELVPHRADGYTKNEAGQYINDMTNLFWVGDGGLHTNLDDMLIWNAQFYAPILGKNPPELIERMNTANSPHRSEGRLYANGQYLRAKEGTVIFEHSGGWLGTSTYFARLPEQQIALVMMCNDASRDVGALADQILARLFREYGDT